MITRSEAIAIAHTHLDEVGSEIPLELLEEETIERDFGWMFFFCARDPSVRLLGPGPFIVDRRDGSLHETGSGNSPEYYLENYARTGDPYGDEQEVYPWDKEGVAFEVWIEKLTGVKVKMEDIPANDTEKERFEGTHGDS